MAKLIDWIRRTSVRILDPQRDERVDSLAREIGALLKKHRGNFDFDTTAGEIGIQTADVGLVKERVYEYALTSAWRDRTLTQQERAGLSWVASALHLTRDLAQEVEQRVGLEVFQSTLAAAVADNRLDDQEIIQLNNIASAMGQTVRELVTTYLMNWGEGFLRGMFAKMAEDGEVSNQEWDHLLATAAHLGLTESELQEAIHKQGERFVEHVLVDAKADGRLSNKERGTLCFLLGQLKLSSQFRSYVESELRELELVTRIMEGRLPVISIQDACLRAGELVHLVGGAVYEEVKQLKSGPQVNRHQGRAILTDARLIFESPSRTFDVNHRKIVGIRKASRSIEVRTTSRGNGYYSFEEQEKLAFLIYDMAVRKANQTVVESMDGLPTRHIPRDVRQRVYQRYGGQCAECSSNQYLEYDHIVPVAKGGSNSDQNVQLLCRRCNLKKSDNI